MSQNPYESPTQHEQPPTWSSYEPWPYWKAVAIAGFVLAVMGNRVRFAILGEFWGPPADPVNNLMVACSTAAIPIGAIMFIVGGVGWLRAFLSGAD